MVSNIAFSNYVDNYVDKIKLRSNYVDNYVDKIGQTYIVTRHINQA